jgi:bacterioferritin-associated ferredoxin
MIICICHAVSDREIGRRVREGCGSFDELQLGTGVATRCGACGGCARECFMQHARVESQATRVARTHASPCGTA